MTITLNVDEAILQPLIERHLKTGASVQLQIEDAISDMETLRNFRMNDFFIRADKREDNPHSIKIILKSFRN